MTDETRALWQVHVAGPDDIHQHKDELSALRHANSVNRQFVSDCIKHPYDMVLCVATVRAVCQRKTGTNGEACGLEPECPDCGKCVVDFWAGD